MQIKRAHSESADFPPLVSQLDAYLRQVNGEADDFYAQFNQIESIDQVVIAYDEKDSAIGCSAMKSFDEQTVEIKRMFVPQQERGKGVATAMLGELEKWATELGYNRCVLETGGTMQDAIKLYEKCEFRRIPNYGQYVEVDDSVCFEKHLNEKA